MKRFFFLCALVIIVLAVGVLGPVGEVASQTAVTATASRSPTPAPAQKPFEWRSLNGPYERVAYALILIPRATTSTLYAGTWGHGVYRSKDGGVTWETSNISEAGALIRALAIMPSSTNILYAGSYGEGLFRSNDGGKHWGPLGSDDPFVNPQIGYPDRDPLFIESILIISDDGSDWFSSSQLHELDLVDPDGLVIRIRDAQDSLSNYLRSQSSAYTQRLLNEYDGSSSPPEALRRALIVELNQLLSSGSLYDEERFAQVTLSEKTRKLVQQNPQGEDLVRLNRMLLAEAFPQELAKRHRIFVGTHYGVWTSDDYGDTWLHMTSGITNTDAAYNVQALAYKPAGNYDQGTLYAGTLDGLYSSHDGGRTWDFSGPPDGFPEEARRILSLAVVSDPVNNVGTLLIGTQGAGLYTLDIENPERWERISSTAGFPENRRAHTIQALHVTSDGVAYAGTVDYGVFESRDGGQTWQQRTEGLPSYARSILSLAHNPMDGTLYAGTYGDSVYRLPADSQEWEPANAGYPSDFPVQKIGFAGLNNESLLTALKLGGLYINPDRKALVLDWNRVPQALPIGPARDVVGLAVSGPNQSTIVIAATNGIFCSEDAGEIWGRDEEGLPPGDLAVNAIAQGRQNPSLLYVSIAGGEGIYRSENGGLRWQPAGGAGLGAELKQVSSLTVGAKDETVYLGVRSGQIYVTYDAGRTWQLLSQVSASGLLELQWGRETAWNVLLYGGPQQILYARTKDGVYVSYDEGRSWQLSQGGFFSSLTVDPYRPWVAYITAPATTLDYEFAPSIKQPSALFVSENKGRTWKWASHGPTLPSTSARASITTLAFDPNDSGQIYAGSDGAGVFQARLPSFERSLSQRFIALSGILSVAFLIFLPAGVRATYQAGRLAKSYGLPLQTWPKLAYLQARYRDEIRLVSDSHTPLNPMERLTLAISPDDPFQPETLRHALDVAGTPTPLTQVEATLNKLVDYQVLRRSMGNFQLISPLLGRIAHVRFWADHVERENLLREVRSESRLRVDAHRLFQLAGFETSTFDGGLRVRSSQAEYGLFGAEQGIYVHLHTSDILNAGDVHQIQVNAARAHEEQLMGKFSFVVASGLPQVEAYRCIAQLRQEKDFHVVLLADAKVRAANDNATARQTLLRSVRRTLGRQDLFILEGPAVDMLDFFGRSDLLARIANDCQAGQTIGLMGMVGVGKTSLAQRLVQRLPDAVVAWVDLPDHATAGIYRQVRQAWLDDARFKFPHWERPQLDSLPEQPSLEQISADTTAIRDSLLGQTSTMHLVAVVDELADYHIASADVQTLIQVIASTENVSLLGVCGPSVRDGASFQAVDKLKPFGPETSLEMVTALAIQMGLQLEEEAIKRLHQASGGHPLILRQLAHLAQAGRAGGEGLIDKAVVDQAIAQYLSRYDQTLSQLWDSLSGEEQKTLRLAASLRLPPADAVVNRLTELGWLDAVSRKVFGSMVEDWLNAQFTA